MNALNRDGIDVQKASAHRSLGSRRAGYKVATDSLLKATLAVCVLRRNKAYCDDDPPPVITAVVRRVKREW